MYWHMKDQEQIQVHEKWNMLACRTLMMQDNFVKYMYTKCYVFFSHEMDHYKMNSTSHM